MTKKKQKESSTCEPQPTPPAWLTGTIPNSRPSSIKTQDKATEQSFTDLADLVVQIQEPQNTHNLLVSSSALRLASSPVWEKRLDPKSANPSLETTWIAGKMLQVLPLTDVTVGAITILFNVLHYRADKVPQKLLFPQLVQIAHMVKQFKCQQALMPWLESWIGDIWDPEFATVTGIVNANDWLLVGLVFKSIPICKTILKEVSALLIRYMVEINDTKDQIKLQHPDPESSEQREESPKWKVIEVRINHIPEDVIHYIISKQRVARNALVPLFEDFLQSVLKSAGIIKPNGISSAMKGLDSKLDRCRDPIFYNMALGSTLSSLTALFDSCDSQSIINTLHATNTEVWSSSSSIEALAERFLAIDVYTFAYPKHGPFGNIFTGATKFTSKNHSDTKPSNDPSTSGFETLRSKWLILHGTRCIDTYKDTHNLCPIAIKLQGVQKMVQQVLDNVQGFEDIRNVM